MNSGKALNPPLSLDQWVKWFKKELAPADMDNGCILAYLHHFADLGILKASSEDHWDLAEIDSGPLSPSIAAKVRSQLMALSLGESGFSIAHFLGQTPKDPFPPATKQTQQEKTIHPERASDLSNLQIVKKVGRQLQPFLELEKNMLSILQGSYTSKEDARKIFSYILNRTQGKAAPKKWEQLSRKRHR